MSEFLIRARGIQKVYRKGREEIPVVRGVDLDISPGERLAIVGASGAGKSTLLHILGTLEPPTAGEVTFGPQSLFKLSDAALSTFRNRELGFVFQFHYLLPEFNALENVMMPALIAGHAKAEAAERAKGLLDFVGLGHRMNHRPSELSGGEQQRVSIARAVILSPKLLLADELTGNLDSANRTMVLELLKRLGESTGVSILIVTHDLEVSSQMHRVLTMRDGKFL